MHYDEPPDASMSPALESPDAACASTYSSVGELAADIGLSERSTRSALRRGEIPHIRVGRRFILPRAAIADWLRTAGKADRAPSKLSGLAVLARPR